MANLARAFVRVRIAKTSLGVDIMVVLWELRRSRYLLLVTSACFCLPVLDEQRQGAVGWQN